MDPLAKRLDEAKGNDSIDAVVERAGRAGFTINRATVAKYTKGQGAKRPPEATLQALAAGLGLDVRELRHLVDAPRGELGPWVPPAESARLDRDQRDALTTLIKAIVAPRSAADRQDPDHGTPIADDPDDSLPTPIRPKGPTPIRPAPHDGMPVAASKPTKRDESESDWAGS